MEYKRIKTADQLESVVEEKGAVEGLKYLFIDEIQNVPDFEEVLNGFRSEGDWSIFITGSNSYLLSGELITKLTGRYLEFEMFPLSFYYAQNTDNLINYGPVLENMTYIYARAHDYAVSVGRIGKLECDFILGIWRCNIHMCRLHIMKNGQKF